jgi:thiol:disulfide interchange protein
MPARPMKRLLARTFARWLSPCWAALVLLAATGCNSGPAAATKEEPASDLGPVAPARVEPPAPAAGESWNTAQIEWFDHASGLARAKAENKPICLVLYTTWCPHCKNYSRVFDDARVVEQAKSFVMIRVDADKEGDLAQKYAKDGGYIPRTYFLAPDGTPDFDVHAPRPKYAYFYDERDPSSLLGGMAEAKRRLVR